MTSWTTAYQAPPSMGFSRQEYWSGLPLSSLRSPISVHKYSTHTYIDYNRLNYGKIVQHNLLLCNLQLSVFLEHMLFAFPFLTGDGYKPYFAQGRTKRGKWNTKREAKRDHCHSLRVGSLPCVRSVLSPVCSIKDLSA